MPSRRSALPLVLLAASLVLSGAPTRVRGAGVTLITHGFNSDVTSWIIPMADAMTRYPGFPGTNSSCYEISITQNGQGQYVTTQTFLAGTSPLTSDSGEIFIKLDWSTLSSGSVSTLPIANAAAAALLSTNLIPALGGHALAELPLHLAGHSRGGSVVTEMTRILGAQGIWVDHVTTLDPHPVSGFGDPAMKNYANILFADNYWQNLGDGLFVPNGQPITGAYNRQLTNLNGGYSSSHSDVHLWYHGTIDFTTPLTVDGATISNSERTNWWTTAEQRGTNTGFRYTLIGGGDRLSSAQPGGAGLGRISDGYRDLSVSTPTNRIALPTNNAAWPNAIRLNLGATNTPAGAAIPFSLYHQSGSNQTASVDLRLFLDADLNPYDTNEIQVLQTALAGTGTNTVASTNGSFQPDPAVVSPGIYRVFARLTDGTRTRYLYAPGSLTLTASTLPPRLTALGVTDSQFNLLVHGYVGQRIVMEASTNLLSWTSITTNTLSTGSLQVSDALVAGQTRRFYRGVLKP
ncbi:MAG: hypothetical protein EPO07_17060 [Verrucomicrobia bacterium]|nr:MAG: hypothetical protein EPO07_17060 [Verrucomicrobiota bacterium]